ncbi:MAG: Methyltransferase domain [Phormidesmis priestleyi Ana]|uniref:Methyltransferase domain n=1 Tax=Phormidesmis priestleyi Ana TaxID=1666911 RepID=A0A0P8C3Q4_9CYAN|nr:MAG: Methyltransferase domain [Phormidesmis priestleyi Ana]
MNWRDVTYPVMAYFRRKRLAELLRIYPDLENYSVLDVGGRPFIWELLKEHYNIVPKKLVLLNTPSENLLCESGDYTVKIADGCNLPYENQSFDLVFSNSVLEHVGRKNEMVQFSQECERVGKKIYIQTPNRWFPVDAHLGVAFIHWLPRPLYKKLCFLSLRYPFTINNPIERRNFDREFETTELLTLNQLQHLFPQRKIVAEKFLFLKKSFVVVSQ